MNIFKFIFDNKQLNKKLDDFDIKLKDIEKKDR